MATLPLRSFSTIVSNLAAGMQGRLSSFLNFTSGSVLLAISESVAGTALWLQGMAVSVLKLTRLATSYGADCDSWLADFDVVKRIDAVAATGLVTFSRYTVNAATPTIPVGAIVKTSDGTQQFQVTADPSNVLYSAAANGGLGGYVLPAYVQSLQAPVISITNGATGAPGANGNVATGSISALVTSVPGIDTVVNVAAFTNGSDAESDDQVKDRFQQAIASLSKGTPAALAFAIQSLRTGLQVQVLSNTDPNGSPDNGMTTVYVDDGSGNIAASILASCQAAAFASVAAGTRLGVYPATARPVSVSLNITLLPGYLRATVAPAVQAAVAAGINGIGLGNEVDYFTVGSYALAVPGVAKIDNLLVNGGTADLPATQGITYKAAGVVVG